METRQKFSISILAMNGLDMTKRCVESVLKHSPPGEFELFLTSNGATDGTADYFLKPPHPAVIGVACARNIGFVEGHNRAFSKSTGQYFIALNNDTEVPSNWLTDMEQPFLNDHLCALVGIEGGCCSIRVNANIQHPKWGPMECPILGYPGKELEYVGGECLMMQSKLIRKHWPNVPFAPYFHLIYCEDTDLSLRMRKLGYHIARVPMQLKHGVSVTTNQMPGMKELMQRNMGECLRRHHTYLTGKPRKLDHLIVVKRSHARGDVLLMTPILKALHEANPNSKIIVETGSPDILKYNPHVFQAFHRVKMPEGAQVIDLNGSYEANPARHIIDSYAEKAMVEWCGRVTKLYPGADDIDHAEKLLPTGGGKWVAIHAGLTTWPGKNWHPSRMEEISKWMQSKGWKVVLTDAVRHADFNLTHDLDLRGDLNYQQLSAVLARCSLFIGLDSFPMHAAQASGCPVVALFGATEPEYIMTDGSPWRAVCADPAIPCAGDRHRIKNTEMVNCDGKCMESISVDAVKQGVEELI